MQKITPCLCFDHGAEDAVNFYASTFADLKIIAVTRCGEDEFGGPEGSVRTIGFELFGQSYLAVNGGSHFKFSDAVSFIVHCDTQQEINTLWRALSDGGTPVRCGWLKDRFGVSWQIVPTVLAEMMSDPDTARSSRVMQAVLKMVKPDIAGLRRAYEEA